MITCRLNYFQFDIKKNDVGYTWSIIKKERWKGLSPIEQRVYDRLWHLCHRKPPTCQHDLPPHVVHFCHQSLGIWFQKNGKPNNELSLSHLLALVTLDKNGFGSFNMQLFLSSHGCLV